MELERLKGFLINPNEWKSGQLLKAWPTTQQFTGRHLELRAFVGEELHRAADSPEGPSGVDSQ